MLRPALASSSSVKYRSRGSYFVLQTYRMRLPLSVVTLLVAAKTRACIKILRVYR